MEFRARPRRRPNTKQNRPMTNATRLIAFHLPQFHPIPENDEWWGKGFTEWTNTGKARPLFAGHRQPKVPADLGYYDLRLPEARAAQAELAREYGIEAFCYYHYWFGGRRLLERPVDEILASGEPDFPFCLCWANESWTGIWHGAPKRVLIEQTYPGEADHRAHFEFLLKAFRDRRYLTVDGRPLFLIYRAWQIPEVAGVLDLWNRLADEAGIARPFFVAVCSPNSAWDPLRHGFAGSVTPRMPVLRQWVSWRDPLGKLSRWWRARRGWPTVYRHRDVIDGMLSADTRGGTDYPCVIPNWDNTPRSGKRGLVLQGSTPELFRGHLRRAIALVAGNAPERQMVFVKSWNEWAEGNHLEPDTVFGRAWLEVVRDELARAVSGVPGGASKAVSDAAPDAAPHVPSDAAAAAERAR